MITILIRNRKALWLSLAMVLFGSNTALRAQHGDSGGGAGGATANAGSTMKLPAKKPARATSTTSRPRTETRPSVADNSAQLEDALSLADDARQAGRNEAAERGYLLAAKLAPNDPRPYLGLGHLYYNQKKYADAERFYTRAAGLSHGDSEPYARLAFTYAEMERLDDALTAARRSVTAQADNYYGYLALGYVLSLRHSYAEAETAYRRSVSLAPQPQVTLHLELARILGEQRRYNDALTEAKKAVDIDGKDFSARFNYALMLQKLGRLLPASEQYLEAIKLNSKDGSPHSNVGLIYYMTENFPAAREHWTTAIDLGSTYAPDRIGLLILDGRLSDAQGQLEEYTRKSADDEDGWLMLGDVYRALGNDSAARVTDARAAQIAPEYVGLRRPNLKSRANANQSPSSWSTDKLGASEVYAAQIFMAKDANGEPGERTTTFEPGDRTIYCMVELNMAKSGTNVKFVWKTINIAGSKNEEIKTVDYTTKPLENKVRGHLTLPSDWPRGTYKVEVYVNGVLNKSLNYAIE